MKVGLLFAGQGSQTPGMGKDFYEKYESAREFYDTLENSDEVKRLSFESDMDTITKTENTQLIMVAFQLMLVNLLKDNGIDSLFNTGLSIGEYGALYSANVLKAHDAMYIADIRGKAMSSCSAKVDTAMYAIIGSSEDEISTIIDQLHNDKGKASISNINSSNQIVVSGEKESVERLVAKLKDNGRKALKLKVSGPFHTEYMKDASIKLKQIFENINFKEPHGNLYLNLTGEKYKGQDLKDVMAMQVMSTVRFNDCIKNMIDDGVDLLIEIGFKSVIKKMIQKSGYKIEVLSLSNVDEFEEVLRRINE